MTNYLEDDTVIMDVPHLFDFAAEVAKLKRDVAKVSRIVKRKRRSDAEDVAAALEDAGFNEDDADPSDGYFHFATSYGGVQIVEDKVSVYIDTGTDVSIMCYVGEI